MMMKKILEKSLVKSWPSILVFGRLLGVCGKMRKSFVLVKFLNLCFYNAYFLVK